MTTCTSSQTLKHIQTLYMNPHMHFYKYIHTYMYICTHIHMCTLTHVYTQNAWVHIGMHSHWREFSMLVCIGALFHWSTSWPRCSWFYNSTREAISLSDFFYFDTHILLKWANQKVLIWQSAFLRFSLRGTANWLQSVVWRHLLVMDSLRKSELKSPESTLSACN